MGRIKGKIVQCFFGLVLVFLLYSYVTLAVFYLHVFVLSCCHVDMMVCFLLLLGLVCITL